MLSANSQLYNWFLERFDDFLEIQHNKMIF